MAMGQKEKFFCDCRPAIVKKCFFPAIADLRWELLKAGVIISVRQFEKKQNKIDCINVH